MTERTVAIIGGGVSGLATAEAIERYAAASGRPTKVIVLESDEAPGGKIKTQIEDGFVIESGPHGFLDKEPKMFELIDRLGIRDELVASNTASARRFIVRAGELRELPSSPMGFLTSDILPFSGKLRVAFEPFMPGPQSNDESVRDFAARRIGPQAADVLVDAMVTGIYGGDPRRLSLKSAFPRMFELERDHGSLVKAQFAIAAKKRAERKALEAKVGVEDEVADGTAPKQTSMGAPTGTLHSFRRGLSTLIDALAARADLRCGQSVETLSRRGQRWVLDARGEQLEVDAVVSTAPAYVVKRLLEPIHPALTEAACSIPYVPCSVVVQAFKPETVRRSVDGFGFLIPGGEERDVLGTIWASTVFPEHAPDGLVMFRSMLGGARRQDLGRVEPQELAERSRSELNHWMGIDPKAEPVLERVIPWARAIPQYEVGHTSRVDAADRVEQELPGLFLSGNAFRGVAVLACVAQGDVVGERVARYLASLEAETQGSDPQPAEAVA